VCVPAASGGKGGPELPLATVKGLESVAIWVQANRRGGGAGEEGYFGNAEFFRKFEAGDSKRRETKRKLNQVVVGLIDRIVDKKRV